MKLKEKISIDEFDGKRYQIRLVEPNDNGKAILTHYLHNIHNGVSKYYKEDALEVLNDFVTYKQEEEKLSIVAEDALQQLLFEVENVPFPTPENYTFKFIDLFAGIGGFRIAMQNLGGKCVFTSEWDKEAQKTYKVNFGEVPFGDITKQQIKNYIPEEFDLLCAGFPCQAFSIAGKRGGFDDTRGTLFFDVAEIIKKHKPKSIFLENVKGLRSHDKGKTLETILNVLRNDLGYYVPEPQIINAKNFGVPQNRERIYIVGFRQDLNISSFEYPKPLENNPTFEEVKEKNVPPTKYYLSTQYVQTLVNHKARHENKGNGFGYAIIPDNGIANAIVVGGMGRERNLVLDHRIVDYTPTTHIKGTVNREGIRKMTPREWARLQGFPDNFIIPVADASAYKQFGNSVAVPAIQATANKILELIGIKNMLSGNKGEWSEIYALFKLLGDKQLFAGSANLNKVEELFYPIIKIIRNESGGNFEYEINGDLVIISGGKEQLRIPVKTFTEQSVKLLATIKASNGAFSIPEIETFMNSINCGSLKAKSTSKSDIQIVIHDQRINQTAELGFSIKSQLGGQATLLNAGKTTNFIYQISDFQPTENQIKSINEIGTKSKIKDRIENIKQQGGNINYVSLEQDVFKNNLVLIDSLLPNILAEIIRTFYTSNLSSIKDLTENINKTNPLNYDNQFAHTFYEYKIKRFLTDVALGMTPSKVWNGIYDATGGYLIVKENGDVLCYHIYNRNQFEDYLFQNTKLETASSSRHEFGKIFNENGKSYFKLNLQIRFK